MVEVKVTDQGLGIPNSLLPHVFKKFYRSHRSRGAVSGTGIGLYVCKAVVEAHGGTIMVKSVEEQGTTITVSLPMYANVAKKLEESGGDNAIIVGSLGGGRLIKSRGVVKG